MNKPLSVLLVEDSPPDADLISAELRRHGYELHCERVQTESGFRPKLEAGRWDVVISDYRLPGFSAIRALEIIQECRIDLPFIIVSGTIGEHIAVAAMKAGAHDYVMKDKLARLVPAVERELRDAEVRRARARAEEGMRFQANLLNAVGQAVVATDAEGRITYWNRPAESLYGWTAAEALGKDLQKLILAGKRPSGASRLQNESTHDHHWFGEVAVRRRDGYLTKNTASELVATALLKVLAGGTYVSPALAEDLANRLTEPAAPNPPHQTLSDREYQIMSALASGKSVKEVSFELALSIKTVSTYRTRLLRKLKLHTTAELIRYAIHEGLVH